MKKGPGIERNLGRRMEEVEGNGKGRRKMRKESKGGRRR